MIADILHAGEFNIFFRPMGVGIVDTANEPKRSTQSQNTKHTSIRTMAVKTRKVIFLEQHF